MRLNRLGRELDVFELKELALEGERLAIQQSSDYLERLISTCTSFAERNTEALELFDLVADPNPKLEAPAPKIASTTAISSASRTGLWNGISSTPSGIRIRFVRAAIAAAAGSIEGR